MPASSPRTKVGYADEVGWNSFMIWRRKSWNLVALAMGLVKKSAGLSLVGT